MLSLPIFLENYHLQSSLEVVNLLDFSINVNLLRTWRVANGHVHALSLTGLTHTYSVLLERHYCNCLSLCA